MNKDLLSINELTADEIAGLMTLSENLKKKQKDGMPETPLAGKNLGMIFMKSSTRTRVSFEVGIFQLGGHGLFLSPRDLQLGRGETIADTAKVLSRYLDGIMIRTFDHEEVVELAANSTIPIINGLTDLTHPCQVLADMFTLYERGLARDFTITYVGDGNNLANSWLNAASIVPMNLRLGVPEGYDPDEKIYRNAVDAGISEIGIFRNPYEAVAGADVIYTDVWTSMGQESEEEERRRNLLPFRVDRKLISSASSDVLVMHCLPAHRGDEITDEVVDGPHSIVFDQAENRLHLQKAVMVQLMASK